MTPQVGWYWAQCLVLGSMISLSACERHANCDQYPSYLGGEQQCRRYEKKPERDKEDPLRQTHTGSAG